MCKYEKSMVFEKELNCINNSCLREFVSEILDSLPDYFYHIGASTSGKFHPSYTIGEGGLIKHSKAAVLIAQDIFKSELYKFGEYNRDIVTSSLILHDGFKCGFTGSHTTFEHPLLMKNYILEFAHYKHYEGKRLYQIEKIANCVASHMGKWNTSKYSDVILPLPQSDMEKCVHLCDYLASRKYLIFDFDVYYEVDKILQKNNSQKI